MSWLNIILFSFVLFGFSLCQVNDEDIQRSHRKLSQLMQHDGVKRVLTIDTANIDKLLKKNHLVAIMFWIDNDKETEKINEKDIAFLETAAQLFRHSPVVIGICEIMANQKLALAAGVKYSGMIKVFNKGRVTNYPGQRSPDVFVPYLSKMLENSVLIITTKAEKKNYDQIDLLKVVAYVNKGSKELQALSTAALSFQPMIPFYVVHDAKLAKLFHLKKLNSLQLIKPYEKSTSFQSKSTFTEEAIIQFIEKNKKQRLTKMRLENIHDVWAIDMTGYVVSMFADINTNEGKDFFSLVKSLSKQFEKNENLTFVWIDPTPFPSMVEYWKQSFGIDPLKPILGTVDVRTQSSAWYERRSGEEYTLNSLGTWLNDIVAGNIQLQPMKQFNPTTSDTREGDEEGDDSNKDEL